MASIEKLEKGKYRVRFRYNKQRYSKVLSSRRECRLWVNEKMEEINSKLYEAVRFQSPDLTLKEVLIKYSKEYLLDSKKRSERIRINKFIADNGDFVDKPIKDVSKGDFREWIRKRSKQVTGSSVCKDITNINNAYRVAINEWDMLHLNNPLIGLFKPKENPPRERIICDDEIKALLKELNYSDNVELDSIKRKVGAALVFSLETAMRAGEICNLKWSDISESGLVLNVKTAKTRSGIREVPLSSRARRVLQQCKIGNEGDSVFRIDVRQLDANYRKYRKQAGLKGFTFHDARATAITRLAKKLDILDLAKIVGHKDPKMLMVYYRQGAEALVDRLG